jgi:biopolymer transport protein ExbD
MRRQADVNRPTPLRLTAMLDVVFLLLIFFVLTATFALNEGVLAANLPGGPARTPEPPQEMWITITPQGLDGVTFAVGEAGSRRYYHDAESLTRQLAAWHYDPVNNPAGLYDEQTIVAIRTHGDVAWQHPVDAVNAARRAGYENISFAP